jgi:hypothetical protein
MEHILSSGVQIHSSLTPNCRVHRPYQHYDLFYSGDYYSCTYTIVVIICLKDITDPSLQLNTFIGIMFYYATIKNQGCTIIQVLRTTLHSGAKAGRFSPSSSLFLYQRSFHQRPRSSITLSCVFGTTIRLISQMLPVDTILRPMLRALHWLRFGRSGEES